MGLCCSFSRLNSHVLCNQLAINKYSIEYFLLYFENCWNSDLDYKIYALKLFGNKQGKKVIKFQKLHFAK